MMNPDGSVVTGVVDDQQMISITERENYIGRLTNYLGGNRDLAMRYDASAYNRSGGKVIFYRKILQSSIQNRNQQLQQQQQQAMMMSQDQQSMYMPSQQIPIGGMPPQQPPQSSFAMQPLSTMMNVKQDTQASLSSIQSRIPTQNFPMHQQQQQIKQELMAPSAQQVGLQVQQMRSQQQQPISLPPQQYSQPQQTPVTPSQSVAAAAPQQRTLVQHLQQVRQQSHLNQQQQQQQQQPQQDSLNPSQLSQQPTSSSAPSQSSSGSQDEILQHLLSSPNPTKPTPTATQNAVQARLRTMNRNVRQPVSTTLAGQQQQQQQQPSPMGPGSPVMTASSTAVSSPHSHSGLMQQQSMSLGPSGQNSITRYIMAQSPLGGVHRPLMSPMNYVNSPAALIDDEIQFLIKFFSERIQYLLRIMARCQQEGQLDKVLKYRQLHDQMSLFVQNPLPEHLVIARRLKDHIDRILGLATIPPVNDTSATTSSVPTSSTRPMTNGIFNQCQRTIVDYLGKDPTLKYSIAKRFLEPLSEVLNGVPHKIIRLDMDTKQIVEPNLPHGNNDSLTLLTNTIESEFAHLSMNTYSYELKPLHEKFSPTPSMLKNKDSSVNDYELTCRLIEMNMPIVPPLKMKLTIQYPQQPPEILSLTSTTMNITPTKLENFDGNTFFESISRNFVYFLFKLPTQHTISDILDIWRTAIRNAFYSQNVS